MKVSRSYFILIAVFLFFVLLHFINLDKRIIFGWDQEQFSYQIKGIITNRDFTLLGPRVNNDRGFFLAPYFTYLLIPVYWLGQLHPAALLSFLVIFNIFFFFFSYFVLKNVFSEKIALFFLILWPLNVHLLNNDVTPWWPVFIPIGVIAVWYLLWKIYDNPARMLYWVLLGISTAFFMNMHFQFIFIIFWSAVFLLLISRKKKISLIYPITATAIFISGFFPLFIFDLRHDFLNTRLFFNFFFSGDVAAKKDFTVWIEVFGNFIQKYVFFNQYYLNIFILGILLYGCYKLSKKNQGFLSIFFLSHIAVVISTILFFTIYGQRPSEYYFYYLAPFILLMIITVLSQYHKPVLLYGFIIIVFLFNIPSIYHTLYGYQDGLYYKDKVAQTIKQKLNNKKFHISYDGPPSTDNGFRYLLEWHGVKQSADVRDPLVQIVRPAKETDIIVGGYGIRVPKELK